MIRITDMTFSCLNNLRPPLQKLRLLLECLALTGIDSIEMPASLYEELRPVAFSKLVLRIGSPDEIALYPEINRFVCRKNSAAPHATVTYEIQVNDVKEINCLSQYAFLQSIRISGLDDVLCHDYEGVFKNIKKKFPGRIEFCPENSLSCASASAVEWVINGGTEIVTSFGGIGGRAPLEEVLVALKIAKRFKPNASYDVFPRIAALMEEILGKKYPANKAVIGKKIFDVESGIHIDGILKKPEMYEPFLPELVGGTRRFIIGKHSGKKAICIKLKEHGIDPARIDIEGLLSRVRMMSIEKMSGLTDEELFTISESYRK